MRTTESKTTSRLIVAGAVVAAVLALALALWGCAPNATGATTDQKGDDKATEETTTSASVYPNFTEKAAGLFPDTYFNRDMLNTGNRGCNACHENLFDKMVNKEGLTHILSYVGYEKDGTYKDCEPCHQGHMTLTGPYLGDAIHASHYGNQQFVDANGNCWSCHAVNSDGEAGEYQFMLWEDFYEQAALGGYPWLADDETTPRLGRVPEDTPAATPRNSPRKNRPTSPRHSPKMPPIQKICSSLTTGAPTPSIWRPCRPTATRFPSRA